MIWDVSSSSYNISMFSPFLYLVWVAVVEMMHLMQMLEVVMSLASSLISYDPCFVPTWKFMLLLSPAQE